MTPLEGSLIYFALMILATMVQRGVINPPKSDKEQDKFYSKK
jgi:hypothetical protein